MKKENPKKIKAAEEIKFEIVMVELAEPGEMIKVDKNLKVEAISLEKIMAVIEKIDLETKDLVIIEDDDKSYEIIKRRGLDVGKIRIALEASRKEQNKPAQTEITKRNDAAKKIRAALDPIEKRLLDKRKAEDDRRAKVIADKADAEQARKDTIKETIERIKRMGVLVYGTPIHAIEDAIKTLHDANLKEERYQEFLEEAQEAKMAALEILAVALTAAKKKEADDAAQEAENARLKEKADTLEAQAKKEAEEKAELEAKVKKLEEDKAQAEKELETKLAEDTIPINTCPVKDKCFEMNGEMNGGNCSLYVQTHCDFPSEVESNRQEKLDSSEDDLGEVVEQLVEDPPEKMIFPDYELEIRYLEKQAKKQRKFMNGADAEECHKLGYAYGVLSDAVDQFNDYEPLEPREDMDAHDKKRSGPEVPAR